MNIPVPNFIPGRIKHVLDGQRFEINLPSVAKAALRTPEKISVAEHARRFRVITDGPHQGEWNSSYSPHSVKIMNTFGLPHVREVWFCAPEQAGKTSTMLNCLHWGCHVAPGDVFYMLPDETSAKKIFSEKIRPMIENSRCLAGIMTGKENDLAMGKIKLANGVRLFPAHATSPASMAMFPARYAFGDEIDKGTELSGREADRVTLIKKRMRLYGQRSKGFFASTPAGLFVYKGVYSCPQVWEYRVLCPACGGYEKFDALMIDGIDTVTVGDIESRSVSVSYSCPSCGGSIDSVAKEDACRRGRWFCVKGENVARPTRVGFHMDAFSCLDISLEEIAIAFLKNKKGNIVDKIAWHNGYMCEDYSYEGQGHTENYILRLVDRSFDPGIERKSCPDDTAAVLIVADAQQVGCWYQVFALGYGVDFSVTVINYGYVKDFEGLVAAQKREYVSPSGRVYRAESGWIDSGGGLDKDRNKHSRTVQVYSFCRDHKNWENMRPFWHPVKGQQRLDLPWERKRLDYYPSSVGKNIPIPGGLILTKVNVTLWKDEVDRRFKINPGEPGCVVLPCGCDELYARQLSAWYRAENGIWKTISGRDDHLGDTFVYMFCIADMLSVKSRVKPVDNGNVVKKPAGLTMLSNGVTML